MESVDVLDTSALISWPVERMSGAVVLEGQKEEVERKFPERMISLEVSDLNWETPTDESVEIARKLASKTGDISGLSSIDLGLLALAIEKNGRLHTDDYRLQNLCKNAGVEWLPVETGGISSVWKWEVRCSGCQSKAEQPNFVTLKKEELGECQDCGAPLRVKKVG